MSRPVGGLVITRGWLPGNAQLRARVRLWGWRTLLFIDYQTSNINSLRQREKKGSFTSTMMRKALIHHPVKYCARLHKVLIHPH